jgi:hypothetical protein
LLKDRNVAIEMLRDLFVWELNGDIFFEGVAFLLLGL